MHRRDRYISTATVAREDPGLFGIVRKSAGGGIGIGRPFKAER